MDLQIKFNWVVSNHELPHNTLVNKHFKVPPPPAPKSATSGRSTLPSADSVIDGRYRIVRKIGGGTSGVVYEGIQLSVERRVAIKILKPGHYSDENYLERFTREAKAIARLSHTNCIALHDFSYSEEIGSLYMVMEYVDGVELFEMIKDGPLPFVRALRIAIQIVEALSHAHRLGILHRDLKPENVVVGKDDVVKVLDFGLARMLDLFSDDAGRRLTADGTIYGTPAYMSPEQCGGELDVTVHSDIYSLGVILYQLFEGRLPFDSREIVAVLVQHKTTPPPPIEMPIPGRLKALIFKMLEKERIKRPSTAHEVADILRAVLLGVAMRDDLFSADVSQEIQLSFLRNEIDESREFIPEPGEARRENEYGLSMRQSGKHRAVRAMMSGRGKTEHLPGQHLDDRYKIVAEIGSGSTSTVFVAEDLKGGQTVAVKVLSADVPEEFRAPERFAREVATLDALDHPNIVRMVGHGFDLSLDRNFIVMEMASGDTLDTLCEENRTSLELGICVARDVAAAIEYAHRKGIIHRDIKPSNIVLVPQETGEVVTRVLDFGLALMRSDHRRLTEQGTIPGTVAYFAPERLKGEDSTTASDIFSLGVVFYVMFSGHQPFEGRSSVDVASAILRGDFPPLSSFVHEVPLELSDLVSQMMHPEPSKRPSASNLRQRIEALSKVTVAEPYRVQHKGPASNVQTAWRLRRRVSPSEHAPAPATITDTYARPTHTTIPPRPITRPISVSPSQAPARKERPVFAIVVAVLILIIILLVFINF